MVRQTIGSLIQLAITQTLLAKHQRATIRGRASLRLDMLVHALGAGIDLLRGIQAEQGGLDFSRRQHRQFANRAFGIGHDTCQQVAPVPGQALDALGIKQIGGISQAGQQPLAFFVSIQLQVKLRRAPRPRQALNLKPGKHPAECAGATLLMVEHDLEQRAVAQAALTLQRLHQTFERQVLIALGIQRTVTGLLQQPGKRQAPVKLGAQHLGVDEKADQTTGFCTAAVGHRHADAQVCLTAVAVQQHLKAGQQQHERGHATLAGQAHQAFGQRRWQCKVQPRPLLRGLRRARTVAGQLQHRLLAAQLPAPPVQLALQLTGFHPAALPQRVITVLDRQGG